MDPRQRLFLEVVWHGLEDAGYPPLSLNGSDAGVFVGAGQGEYVFLDREQVGIHAVTGAMVCMIANRISYFLGLRGPSWTVDTASSSSLTAVHQACQNLALGECELALAGGVNLMVDPALTGAYRRGEVLGQDRCRPFDVGAGGFVRGEGGGVVVLKRLHDALDAEDRIYAVIRGSAVNQDGSSTGLTAPSARAQAACMRRALAGAGIEADALSYVEAHGSGTVLGDRTELESLTEVLAENRTEPCLIGSVKSNIGHLEAAAGIAGLIKTVLSLYHGTIPPTLHHREMIPAHSAVQVITETRTWPESACPGSRFAGVNAFGLGGANAHVIVASLSQDQPKNNYVRPFHLAALSAADEDALRARVRALRDGIAASDQPRWLDLCHANNLSRSDLGRRAFIVARDQQDAILGLDALLARDRVGKRTRPLDSGQKVVFLFTGQGSQYIGMGHALYKCHPVFRETVDRCNAVTRALKSPVFRQWSLVDVLCDTAPDSVLLQDTAVAQMALFAVEVGLARMLLDCGVRPDLMLGHSLGEIAAAHLAGVFGLEDAVRLVEARSRLMASAPGHGLMASVFAAPDRVRQCLAGYENRVGIAALNGPGHTVISGFQAEMATVLTRLERAEIPFRRLKVSHAFHSPQMDPILDRFEDEIRDITFQRPRIPIISNLDGELADEALTRPDYWRGHIRQPVRFVDGLHTVGAQGGQIMVEIGPKPVLLTFGKECLTEGEKVWVPTLTGKVPEWQAVFTALGRLHENGQAIDWRAVDRPYAANLVALPGYPFRRQTCWLERTGEQSKVSESLASSRTKSANQSSRATESSSFADRWRTAAWAERPVLLTMRIREVLAELLGFRSYREVDPRKAFKELGVDSGLGRELALVLERLLERALSPTVFFNYPNTEALVAHLLPPASREIPASDEYDHLDVDQLQILMNEELKDLERCLAGSYE